MKTTMQAIFTPAGRTAGFSLPFQSPFLLLAHFRRGAAICLTFTRPSCSLISPPRWIHLFSFLPPLRLILCFSTYFWIIYLPWNFLSNHSVTFSKKQLKNCQFISVYAHMPGVMSLRTFVHSSHDHQKCPAKNLRTYCDSVWKPE